MKKIVKVFSCGLLVLSLFSFFSCDSMSGNKDSDSDSNKDKDGSGCYTGSDEESFKARLNSFGFSVENCDALRPEVDSSWEPLEGNYEIPTMSGSSADYKDNVSGNGAVGTVSGLASSLFSRMKMTEVYVCGSGTGTQYDGVFNYEGNTINQVSSFTNSDYIANTVVRTKALDLNGDAYEDIVIASFDRTNKKITLYARLYNPKGSNYLAETTLWTKENEHVSEVSGSTNDQGFDCFDFTIGDFDGDNRKEFAVSICYKVNGYGKAEIYLIDDYKSSCKDLYKFEETETFADIKKNDSSKVFKFASADLNGDGYDEIYAAIGVNGEGCQGYYKVYSLDSSSHNISTLACNTLDTGDSKYNKLCAAMVDIGDIDGDGEMEVVYEGRQKDNFNCKCLVLGYDKSTNEYKWEASSGAKYDGNEFKSEEKPYMPMAIGDIDQDGIEEIILDSVALKYNNKSSDVDKIETICTGGRLPCEAGNGGVCVGDFNYDGKNEVAQVNWDGSKLFISTFDASSKKFTSTSMEISKANSKNNGPVSICPIASKKGIARFTFKKHYLQFTEPDVVALVAAPLYFSEDYNGGVDPEEFQPSFGNQGTSIGTSTSSSSSVDGHFTINVSASGGLCFKDPTGITGLQVKVGATLEETYEHTWGESESEEFDVSYCTHEKDMVVVKVTPMDVYVYEISNMPGAPECVGDLYYISLPRTSYVKVCEVDFYESHKSVEAPSVKALFTHTAGNPLSYDNYEDTLKKINNPETTKCTNSEDNKVSKDTCFIVDKNKMESLPQGNVETTMSFSKNSEKYKGDGFDIAAGVEAEVEVEGAYASWGIAFGGGDSWTTSVGKGTTIEGTVVGIDAKYADDYSFRWAIVSYPVAVEGKYLAPMVTYIVEK